jgi:hypothetical protein
MADDLFDTWCTSTPAAIARHRLEILSDTSKTQPNAIKQLQAIVPTHYEDPARFMDRMTQLGYASTAKKFRERLPTTKMARSGELGEILATEYVNRRLDFVIPIKRLRWKDSRELPMRGTDLIGFKVGPKGIVGILKGEAKSRKTLLAATVDEAEATLARHQGRPDAHTLNFIVDRLYETNQEALARQVDDYTVDGRIAVKDILHLLFVLSGNDSKPLLEPYLNGAKGMIRKLATGLIVHEHQKFLEVVYEKVFDAPYR